MACLCNIFLPILQTCTILAKKKKKTFGAFSHTMSPLNLLLFPSHWNLIYSWGIAAPTKGQVSTPTTLHQQADTPVHNTPKSPNNKGVTLQPRHSITHAHCTDAKRRIWWETQSVLTMLMTAPSTKHHLHLYVYFLFSLSLFTVDQVPSKWLQTLLLCTRIRSHI